MQRLLLGLDRANPVLTLLPSWVVLTLCGLITAGLAAYAWGTAPTLAHGSA